MEYEAYDNRESISKALQFNRSLRKYLSYDYYSEDTESYKAVIAELTEQKLLKPSHCFGVALT